MPAHLVHDQLDQKVWDGDRLRHGVRMVLLAAACDFIEHLGVVPKEAVEDVVLTGSMANYNWTDQSDLDVHPIINVRRVDEDEELVNELLQEKRATWNETRHPIVMGHPVEAYPQDSKESHVASGVYSLLRDEWITKPDPTDPHADVATALMKAQLIAAEIERLAWDSTCDAKCITTMREKIRRFRKCGLDHGGEFSTENLAFKALRRSGHLELLSAVAQERRDQELSLG